MEKQMKPLDDEIQRLDAEITRLQALREGVIRAKELLSPGGLAATVDHGPRKRSLNIKPLILDVMLKAEGAGATSAEVLTIVRQTSPNVTRETVGSILSRLKADNALVYDGVRYFARTSGRSTLAEDNSLKFN
jgi:hypothetical protein